MTPISADLGRRLEWARRQVELPAGRYQTLLTPSAMADLFIYLYSSTGAKDALDGRTVFSKPGGGTRVGERLANLPVTMRSDPDAAGLRCAPFVITRSSGRDASVFDNGLAIPPVTWLHDGVLTALTQTRWTAGESGMPVTPDTDNLILESAGGGGASLDDLIAKTRRGLLVTCLWYIREVDPQTLLLTGLTRDGVYLVENGEVTGAVNNFRFNESPVGLLGRLAEVGATEPALAREWSDVLLPVRPCPRPGSRTSTCPRSARRTSRGRSLQVSSSRGPSSGVLQPEAHLQPYLVVGHLVVPDLAADLGHLEPVQVPEGLRGAVHRVADRGLDAFG